MAQPLDNSDRTLALQRALAHYEGRPRNPLKVANGVDDNLIISLARVVVDKGASFLFGQEVLSQIADEGMEAEQDTLDEIWRRNKRGLLLQKLAINGGIFGHAFVRILDTHPYPRIIVLDPQTVDVTTDPDDIDDVWQYTITEPDNEDDAEPRRRTVVSNQNAEAGYNVLFGTDDNQAWTIREQQYVAGSWVEVQTFPWPYPFAPVLGCQNIPKPNAYWGESDLPEDVLKILEAINRVASHYNKIIRLHAHPKVWTRGMGAQKLNTAIDSVIHLPAETAELRALEMQSDLGSTKALLDELLDLLSWMVRIPLVAFGRPDDAGAMSGVALQIRYQPLIEKTEAKRLTYGDLLIELDRCLLHMQGFGDSHLTNLVWPVLLPSDPLMERQSWQIDQMLGIVSKRTLAHMAGYDYDKEVEEMAKEGNDPNAELDQWQQSALSGGSYTPRSLPPATAAAVQEALKHARGPQDIKAVFGMARDGSA